MSISTTHGSDTALCYAGSLDLSRYDAEQHAAIICPDRQILVSAAAGSGKTRTIEGRALWLLSCGVPPEQMCFVTFTVAGAKVMRQRLADADPAFGVNACNVGHIGTLHSLMLRCLRTANPTWSVLYPEDADDILFKTAAAFKDKTPDAALLALRAAWWRESETLRVGSMKPAQRTLAAYYAKLLGDHLLDYDAILWRGLSWIRQNPFPWAALFVDEFQDSSAIDFAIYNRIECGWKMMTGDADQSIYKFRGGDVQNILDLAADPDVRHFQLRTNYRSARKIVEASQRLIRHNRNRIDLDARAHRPEPGTVGVIEVADWHSQNLDIAERVRERIAAGIAPQDIAVLSSTHSVAWGAAEALREAEIPVRQQTKADLPKDWKITRLLIALLAQPRNWGIGEIVLRKCRGFDDFQIRDAKAAGAPHQFFHIPLNMNPEDALNELGRLGAGTDSILAVRKWIDRVQPQTLQELQLGIIASDETEIAGDGVYVGTIHSGKGREWRVVILAGCEEGILPFGDLDDPINVEEQRRLAYVAVTRAMDELWIYAAGWREFRYGPGFAEKKQTGASRFISEMKP